MVIPLSLSQGLYLALIGAVALERLLELRISRRNATAAFARGGIERGQRHFVWMTALHSAFLLACPAEVLLAGRSFTPSSGVAFLALVFLAQALRYWAINALGTRWNVRVIVVPGETALRRGPYRLLRHPNYLAVVLEGVALPMVHGAWVTALAFSALNAMVLIVRVRCEERALREHAGYARVFGAKKVRTG